MQSDGQFGYRMYRYRNATSADTITLALVRIWRDMYELYHMAIERGIDAHVVCHWMLPETQEYISREVTK